MTNPTRQEIINAHRALTSLSVLASDTSMTSALANEKIVRASLPPFPELTMAEIEWNDDVHYLAEAEHTYWGKVIMLYRHAGLRQIQYLRAGGANEIRLADPADLTPTGKRYTLTEVQE
ncbi:hypothetical protein [Corynebacterium aurimucosum]|uniref:hypothetical protein n=1 Tax=Corynebacterium aurimucosum TaxID=169292 RepID=UPI0039905543